MILQRSTYARIGLLGNPSDGFHGRTISCLLRNFHATVTLWESPTLQIVPSPVHDPTTFDSLDELAATARRDGYEGGVRLLMAACKRLHDYCLERRIHIQQRNFTLAYETTIPRQVGLGGSSAIVVAALEALMDLHGITQEQVPLPLRPALALSVETEELGIAAGLQDRVVQVYGGLTYMDFAAGIMEAQAHGFYERMDSSLLPLLFLAYVNEPRCSGTVHSDVKFRYARGDEEVVEGMRTLAGYALEGKRALEQRDRVRLAELMTANFDTRRKLYGDAVLGERNLQMIRIGRDLDAPTKFAGSGGAIVGMYDSDAHFEALCRAYQQAGIECIKADVI